MAIYGEMEGIEILFDVLQQNRLRKTRSVIFVEIIQTTTVQRWQIKRKKPPEDAPEIKMVVSDPGQPLSIQFQILITTKQSSVNGLSNATFNTSKEKNSTNDLNENSIFDEDRFNTKPKQHNHSNRETANGNCLNGDKARTARDSMTQFTSRKTERFKHIIFSLTYDHFNLIYEIFSYRMQEKFNGF